MKKVERVFINGEWLKGYSFFDEKNPYTLETIYRISRTDNNMLNKALEGATKSFQKWKQSKVYERAELLLEISKKIKEQKNILAKTIAEEAGKPITLAEGEVDRCVSTFRIAAEEIRTMRGEVISLDSEKGGAGKTGIAKHFPLGVVLAITPFNFPLNLAAHKIAPAIAAGNSVILKPSSKTVKTALLLAEIFHEVRAEKGIFNVVTPDYKDFERLIFSKEIKKLTFTGSADVGWKLKCLAAKKRVTLELGGNAAAVVDKDMLKREVIKRLAIGSFAYAGQICISVQRIYVHESIYEEFLSQFVKFTEEHIPTGNPFLREVLNGPIISPEERDRVMSWIKEAISNGAKLLTGGEISDTTCILPTVLIGVKNDLKISKEEVFGPVVHIEPFSSLEDAISMVNDSKYGLQAAIFSENIQNVMKFYKEVECGGIIHNDYPTFRVDQMPYGGEKMSGQGREGLRYAIEDMSIKKLLVISS